MMRTSALIQNAAASVSAIAIGNSRLRTVDACVAAASLRMQSITAMEAAAIMEVDAPARAMEGMGELPPSRSSGSADDPLPWLGSDSLVSRPPRLVLMGPTRLSISQTQKKRSLTTPGFGAPAE
eukprot:4263824-Prymnesium_polylepis.1